MDARLRVSRGALLANYRKLQGCGGAVAAVVKADAYGLGGVEVAQALWAAGCDTFFVATVAEGCALRAGLSEATIYVFDGVTPTTVQACRRAGLRPVLNSPQQVRCWRSFAFEKAVEGTVEGGNCAVHVDTGMGRLGFDWRTFSAELVADLPVKLLLTHLACADTPDHPLNQLQLERFQTLLPELPAWPRSFANSAAALTEDLPTAGLVRAGIGLYGGNPFAEQSNPMAAVVTLDAPVLQLRDLAAGDSVGYGATWIARERRRLAVLGIGYADGVPRSLGARGQVWLGGQRCPIIGRVSMDLLQVDVTGVRVEEGDRAEVFGQHIPLDEYAAWQDTTAYEALTRVGSRVRRCFES